MKTKSMMRALTILGAALITHTGLGQVMIEGGSNGVRMSNRDGKTEVPASMAHSQTITTGGHWPRERMQVS